METLKDLLRNIPSFDEVVKEIKTNRSVISLSGFTESAKAGAVDVLGDGKKYKLIVASSDFKVKQLADDYRFFDKNTVIYPAKDLLFYQADIRGNELTIERMKALKRILENKPTTLITTFSALLTRQGGLDVLLKSVIKISKFSTVEEKALSHLLVKIGYEKTYQVEQPGQFSIRGGIVDIFELTEENPYRIELWGDDVESIRSFDVLSQRSIEELSSVSIFPATEMILTDDELRSGIEKIEEETNKQIERLKKEFLTEEAHRLDINLRQFKEEVLEFRNTEKTDGYINYFYDKTVSLVELFPQDNTVIFIDEPLRTSEHAKAVTDEFKENMSHRLTGGYIIPGQTSLLYEVGEIVSKLRSYPVVYLETLPMHNLFSDELLPCGKKYEFKVKDIPSYNGSFENLVRDLTKYKSNGYKVLLLSGSRTRAQRLAKDLLENDLSAFYTDDPTRTLKDKEIETYYGHVSKGYEYPDLKLAVISETDIFGARHQNKKRRKVYDGASIRDFNELNVGDYVVHEFHGLGIYRGIEQIVVEGVTKDYLKIEYRDNGALYIPATGLSVLQKYASSDAKAPKLNKLGTQEWNKTKAKVKLATEEIAKDLVELYATRQNVEGYSYSKDTVWQKEFEEMFPYEETEDQLRAIEDTKADMESNKIMDRLICGDVGFGKTEIAIRAAFKAVQEGKQVVFLVPTTILAQQHYDTFTERMKGFPVRIDLLSRFRTAKEIKETVTDLKKGMVDIVIGTHRILSKDVEFKDLGLLIIDEEQRFGVTHKEKIKKYKETVDVLTLTATPIPRTLHMSLIGIRDMSLLNEAPNLRQPIQTYVMEYNEEMVREAIMRELGRGGQVYYVYNRVNNIEDIAAGINKIVPEARVAYAHGQMPEKDLEYVMYEFINHEVDVLVSTTIIETGMDISNVNTMIIHDSDRLGLSQLYQLRGRVGRSDRTAYAFLMYKKDKYLKEEAEKRLSAIKEFTDLGSGYKIAMKDLEIRGAGNLLGKSQHGHMQAVGYDLYCKMLNEAVMNLKGYTVKEDFDTVVELDVDAYIPNEYIVNEIQKLDIYKRIAGVETKEEYENMEEELLDRFGKVPVSARNLLRIALIRASAHNLYMTEVKGKDRILTFKIRKDAPLNPDGVINLFKKYEKLSFSNKTYEFIMTYPKTGFSEKDERELLLLTENLLEDMKEELLE